MPNTLASVATLNVPILLAVSPLAAMRSAPVMTASMRPSRITWAAAESQMSVASMPCCSQLPHGEPCALQQRAGFVGPHVRALAAAGQLEDHGERGAVAAGGQRAGVAMREDAGAVGQVGQQIGAVAGHGGALLAIFFVDRAGFGEK